MTDYFVLTNDPDHGVTEHYRTVFRELTKRDIFVTTAVFCTLKDDETALARHCYGGETHHLSLPGYRDLMLELADLGHEIAFHGYSQVSDTRDEFRKGLDIFHRTFGRYPAVYIEHGGSPATHSMEMCKRETLAVEGAEPQSDYYVKDILQQVFEVVWTQEYLLDFVKRPLDVREVLYSDGGILYFKRWRMAHVDPLFGQLSGSDQAIVGYTHFGYRGYEPRRKLKTLFRKRDYPQLECWSRRHLDRTVSLLAHSLAEHGLKSLTLSDLLKTHRGDPHAETP